MCKGVWLLLGIIAVFPSGSAASASAMFEVGDASGEVVQEILADGSVQAGGNLFIREANLKHFKKQGEDQADGRKEKTKGSIVLGTPSCIENKWRCKSNKKTQDQMDDGETCDKWDKTVTVKAETSCTCSPKEVTDNSIISQTDRNKVKWKSWVCGKGDTCKVDRRVENLLNPGKSKCTKACDEDAKKCQHISSVWSTDKDKKEKAEDVFKKLADKCFPAGGVINYAGTCKKTCGCFDLANQKKIMTEGLEAWRKQDNFVWEKTSIYGACRVGPDSEQPGDYNTEVGRGIQHEELCAQRCAREPDCKGYEYSKWVHSQDDCIDEKTQAISFRANGGKCELHWATPDGEYPDKNPDFSCYIRHELEKTVEKSIGRKDLKGLCNDLCTNFLGDITDVSCDKIDEKDFMWVDKLLTPFKYKDCMTDPKKYLFDNNYLKCFGDQCESMKQ